MKTRLLNLLTLALLVALFPGAGWAASGRRRARARRGLCVNCGYDLRATPGRCPECGHPPSPVGRLSEV